ncbi:hypothetical protein HanRHA438_Chr11g0526901 [Helianthus annuus]|uniref:Uncharacterized protein n=1 Tax=Helianthus annuus TaxID=4232 RepID=A0A9K3HT50_HELAN|nr:hypothetical protein HanXRQr2_Chr11g0515091 [Helianthus annuus]KAJ0503270.1 hypothetical protein HanHA300_Chr11g0422421 [Helianthus annuus]KAJ0511569.1 hypothetical protein HanIR_Chr11g0553581 [Helianthus annuus]KAJ0519241.1 hypothetical protein HanHA89_Chr11g0446601 [Helianthus annuus]KAJ0687232.1 hypothetical protein HanLR1_Chr11g0423811 [Helianthus annuus]
MCFVISPICNFVACCFWSVMMTIMSFCLPFGSVMMTRVSSENLFTLWVGDDELMAITSLETI